MKTAKRILVVHTDAPLRRMLTMVLIEAGLEVRAVESDDEALEHARTEDMDLALIGDSPSPEPGFQLAARLREVQEALPVVMLLRALDLPAVVQGIRAGLTDVLPLQEDTKPVVRRILALVGLEPESGPTCVELAEAEALLTELDPALETASAGRETAQLRERLRQALREVQAGLEVVAAAQAGIDEKARLLARDRMTLRREQAEIIAERRNWTESRHDLEERERNLRAYEERLRQLPSPLDPEATRPPFPMRTAEADGVAAELAAGWALLRRERTALDAERAMFRDERMVLRDLDRQIRSREERLRELEQQLCNHDRVRRGLPLPPPAAFAKGSATAQVADLDAPKRGGWRNLLRTLRPTT